jgi:lysophospholipase L1-like esterase
MISRRTLLAAALGSLPAGALLGSSQASARPIVATDTTLRRYGPVMLIGDSTCGGYIGGLHSELVARSVGPFRYDIQGSRSITRASSKYPSGLAAVSAARADGFDPKAFVVALGANDLWFVARRASVASTMIDALLAEIGADRTVVFLTTYSTRPSAAPRFNAALVKATATWPHLHVLDWAAVAAPHRQWHTADGVHFTPQGAVARDHYLVDAMILASQWADGVVDPQVPRPVAPAAVATKAATRHNVRRTTKAKRTTRTRRSSRSKRTTVVVHRSRVVRL